jgi:hypothetical protein
MAMSRFVSPYAVLLVAVLLLGTGKTNSTSPEVRATTSVMAGEYIARFAGCNDCHTPGWPASNGTIPTAKWLVGSAVGLRGPFGTQYPINVRLFVAAIPRDAWIALFKSEHAPGAMPFWNWSNGKASDADIGAV